ncbi:hypothetical protein ACFWIA_16950 [Streptomyces sp. NPDC127068]|uniref:hypothetical protein n=1 Tax=Streptomyces sp. NPDC127068 TaxID=3347127 RepID=UPI003655A15D
MIGLGALVLWTALIVWALERNHRRRARRGPAQAGGADGRDRDAARARSELRAVAGRTD